jgi:hypothetical protein
MDATIDDTTSYFTNYSRPSYVATFVTNFSTPYATRDIHNSATHIHNDYNQTSKVTHALARLDNLWALDYLWMLYFVVTLLKLLLNIYIYV